jgi:hypothetical protein
MLYQLSYVRAAAQVSRIPLLLHARAGPAGVLGKRFGKSVLLRGLRRWRCILRFVQQMLDDYSSGGRGHYRGVREQVGRDAAELFNERRGRIGAADAECGRPNWKAGDTIHLGHRTLTVLGKRDEDADQPPVLVFGSGGVARAARGDEYKGESYLGGLTVGSRPPGGDLLANSALPQGGEGDRSACRLGATRPRTSRGRLLAEPPSWPSAIGMTAWLMVLTFARAQPT